MDHLGTPSESRARQIVDDWNTGDIDRIMSNHAEGVALIGLVARNDRGRQNVDVAGKGDVKGKIAAGRSASGTLQLVSSFESEQTISMVLRVKDGVLVTVAIDLNEEGEIAKVVYFRSGE